MPDLTIQIGEEFLVVGTDEVIGTSPNGTKITVKNRY